MLQSLIPVTLLAVAAPALVAVDAGVQVPGIAGSQVTTMTFHERVIVRVPRLGPPPPQIVWKEKRGPKCIAAGDLAGALVAGPSVVDLVLTGNRRVRAKLDSSCVPLDFYSGFYLKTAADGQICADRDSIQARSGTSCRISAFKTLKPEAAKR